jgi:small glutamine-rich tetratricopeptide repeat-containing protein alpha
MAEKNYAGAIEEYTKALELDPMNTVLYSNRAAAFSQNNQHEKAVADSQKAIELDPEFSKAYSRLG